ncbi:hypothetical protein [Candidatus Chloroploca sp. Khr17]|uniref:hypothetical protein n=1 Tax=Candidatus Chloroploca sp. Khr17 TaxID=2496869 RepID=UPI00101B978D|nr:hypothetical protein [Candidatus Chloroploca sp. Khr17]
MTRIDDENLTHADHAALARALAEPGVSMNAEEFALLLDEAARDDELATMIRQGNLTGALLLAQWNAFERANPYYGT